MCIRDSFGSHDFCKWWKTYFFNFQKAYSDWWYDPQSFISSCLSLATGVFADDPSLGICSSFVALLWKRAFYNSTHCQSQWYWPTFIHKKRVSRALDLTTTHSRLRKDRHWIRVPYVGKQLSSAISRFLKYFGLRAAFYPINSSQRSASPLWEEWRIQSEVQRLPSDLYWSNG